MTQCFQYTLQGNPGSASFAGSPFGNPPLTPSQTFSSFVPIAPLALKSTRTKRDPSWWQECLKNLTTTGVNSTLAGRFLSPIWDYGEKNLGLSGEELCRFSVPLAAESINDYLSRRLPRETIPGYQTRMQMPSKSFQFTPPQRAISPSEAKWYTPIRGVPEYDPITRERTLLPPQFYRYSPLPGSTVLRETKKESTTRTSPSFLPSFSPSYQPSYQPSYPSPAPLAPLPPLTQLPLIQQSSSSFVPLQSQTFTSIQPIFPSQQILQQPTRAVSPSPLLPPLSPPLSDPFLTQEPSRWGPVEPYYVPARDIQDVVGHSPFYNLSEYEVPSDFPQPSSLYNPRNPFLPAVTSRIPTEQEVDETIRLLQEL